MKVSYDNPFTVEMTGLYGMNVLLFYFGMGSPYVKFSYNGKVQEILYPKESGYTAWVMASGNAESVKVGRECFPEYGYLGPPEFANV